MSDLRILEMPLPGLYVLECPQHQDKRGDLTKLFHIHALKEQGLDFHPAEIFVTRSKAGVLRGMHFQVGESAHDKLIFCSGGRVLDVVVDVRPNSINFNRPFAVELNETSNRALFINKGYAHGFLALEGESSMTYATNTVHSPSHDRGVLWSSIAFDWPIQEPILSLRDSQHAPIKQNT